MRKSNQTKRERDKLLEPTTLDTPTLEVGDDQCLVPTVKQLPRVKINGRSAQQPIERRRTLVVCNNKFHEHENETRPR